MRRIMVVDDSLILDQEVRRLLEGSNYEVVSYCQNGETAISAYRAVRPDLVTMDIIMPGKDGLETARSILEYDPKANVVMMSSLVYDDTLNEANALGAKGFLCKPFDREELLAVLDHVFQEG